MLRTTPNDDGAGAEKHTGQAGAHPFKELILHKKQEAAYHIVRDSKGSKYVCEECGKKFIRWCNFQKHLKDTRDVGEGKQIKGKQIKCSICEEKFSTVESLQKHVMIHKTEGQFYCCALCGEKFLRQCHLSHHRCIGLSSKLLPIKNGTNRRRWKISEVDNIHCPICNKLYRSNVAWQKHMNIHMGQQNLKCDLCSKAFTGRRELRNHMTLHTGERPFECSWCPKRCSSKSNMAIHEKTHMAVYYLCCLCGQEYVTKSCMQAHKCGANQNGGSYDETKFLCNVCGKNCGSISALKEHISAHKGTHPHTCSRCGEGFKLEQDLRKHHKKERPSSGCLEDYPYQCTMCLKRFSTQVKLKSHERNMRYKKDSQHNPLQKKAPTLQNNAKVKAARGVNSADVLLKENAQNYDAESTKEKPEDRPSESLIGIDTHKKPNRESELNKEQDAGYHTIRDSKGIKYVCEECGKKVIKWGNFQKHMKDVHDETVGVGKQIKCSICEEKVSTVESLQKHVMVHKTESEYYCCALCGEKFLRQYHLSHHRCHLLSSKLLPIKNGSKNRKWQNSEVDNTHCPICNKLYGSNKAWQVHMSIHLGQQNFKCPVCSQAFTGRRELRIHMTLHTGERPFKCSWCPKRCSSKSNIAIHEKSHVAVYYKCCVCGKEFTEKDGMQAHTCGAERNGGPDSDRKFLCNVCGENCASVSVLKQHVVSHADTHPHMCPRCGQGFNLEQDLRKHYKIRRPSSECLDDYPFHCAVCLKRFSKRFKLNAHERNVHSKKDLQQNPLQKKKSTRQNNIKDTATMTPHSERVETDNISSNMHTVVLMEDCADDQRLNDGSVASSMYMYGLQEYPCFLCDKKLPTKNKLKSHLKIHTGVKPHGCSKCEKRFDFRSALKKHKKSHKKKK